MGSASTDTNIVARAAPTPRIYSAWDTSTDCGSMVLADLLCAVFPRVARKNRTRLERSVPLCRSTTRQLR